jgi:hypothetical protein
MAFATTKNSPIAFALRHRFGTIPTVYGWRVFGVQRYGFGAENYLRYYGQNFFGVSLYGNEFDPRGIYQVRHCKDGKRTIKMKYYRPGPSDSEVQATNRQKFADAITAWHNLTNEQKAVYNRRAVGKNCTGFNLKIKEYMVS